MGRRSRAFRRFVNQVVRVTRTAFLRCVCGEKHAIVEQYVVPASALFKESTNLFGVPEKLSAGDSKTSSYRPSVADNSDTSTSFTTTSYRYSLGEVRNLKCSTFSNRRDPRSVVRDEEVLSPRKSCCSDVKETANSSKHSVPIVNDFSGEDGFVHTSSSSASCLERRRSCATNSSDSWSSVSLLQSKDVISSASSRRSHSCHSNRSTRSQDQTSAGSTENERAAENKPVVVFSACQKWASINPSSLQTVRKFYSGAVGQVELVSSGIDRFVRKKMTSSHVPVFEAGVTIDVQCDYVVKLLACFSQDNATIFYFPYYCMRDLYYWMKKDESRSVFTEDMSVWTTLHILAGIREIHKKGIIHMDIKPSNVLISNRGYPVLTDFGGAVRTSDPCRAYCFTKVYMCPEFILEENKLVKDGMADFWAAGITFYELITGDLPEFQKGNGATANSLNLKFPGLSETADDFLSKTLNPEPSERLGFDGGAEDLLNHPLFSESEWMECLIDRGLGIDSPLLHRLLELKGG